MERRAWIRGVWEMVKEALCQKILTSHLPRSPLLLLGQVSGLNIIVTGATSGIGLYTARELAMAGAHVVMACRNIKSANEIASQWQQQANSCRTSLHVEVMCLDLVSLLSVRHFAEDWERRRQPLHVLINNAGVLLMGEPQRFSEDGMEQHMQVNHIAPALLTLLLLPSLLRPPSSRIINVNSVAHHCATVEPKYWNSRIEEKRFSSLRAYGASKLAHLMFMKILASKLLDEKKSSIQSIAVHPGIVTTNLVHNPSFRKRSFWRFDVPQGARSVLFCVSSMEIANYLVKGFAYYSCNCKPARVSPQASDLNACLEVWQKTLQVLDLSTDYVKQVLADTLSKRVAPFA